MTFAKQIVITLSLRICTTAVRFGHLSRGSNWVSTENVDSSAENPGN